MAVSLSVNCVGLTPRTVFETIPDIGEDGRLVCAVIILGISILHYTDLRDRHQEAV